MEDTKKLEAMQAHTAPCLVTLGGKATSFSSEPAELKMSFKATDEFTHSETNIGLCSSINKAAQLASFNYILYSHDDMYFCPDWDDVLINEIKSINHEKFYLSGTMIEANSGHIVYNFGDTINNFKEVELLSKYKLFTTLELSITGTIL